MHRGKLFSSPDDQLRLFKLEQQDYAAALLLLLLFSAILAPALTEGGGSADLTGGGSLLRQSIYLALFGLTLLNARLLKGTRDIWVVPISITLVLSWSFVSLAWALSPGVAARRLILTTLIIWTIFLLIGQCGRNRAVTIIRWALAVLIFSSLIAVLLAPDWAIHQSASEEDPTIVGAWRGILGQKNFAGAVCALAILFFGLDVKRIRASLRWCVLIAAAFFLWKTQSKTSIALLATCIGMAWLYRQYDPYYQLILRFTLFVLMCIGAIVIYANWAKLIAPFSREDFLTGRSQIWPLLLQYASDHLLLGTGFGSFWNVGQASPIYIYTSGWVSKIASGHNGFLDLLTQIGLPGLILAFWAVFLKPFSRLISVPLDKSKGGLILGCIWFCVWHNLTESSLFNRDEAVEVFLMMGLALLRLEVRNSAVEARAAADTLHVSNQASQTAEPGRGALPESFR